MYPDIAAPPSLEGADHVTVAAPFPGVTDSTVGADGTPRGTTGLDGPEGTLVPTSFVAVAVNEYDVPFDNPETTIGDPEPDADAPPGDATTEYDVTGDRPLETGAEKDTEAAWFCAVATGADGDEGAVGASIPVPTGWAVTVLVLAHWVTESSTLDV